MVFGHGEIWKRPNTKPETKTLKNSTKYVKANNYAYLVLHRVLILFTEFFFKYSQMMATTVLYESL